MGFFPDGTRVRLRSRACGTYLHAEEDGGGVALRQRCAAVRAVRRPPHRLVRGGTSYVLPRCTAAYGRYLPLGRYLALVLEDAPPGQGARRGCRAAQRVYDAPEQDDLRWEAIEEEDGPGGVLMRHRTFRPWSNFDNPSPLMSWVEAIPPRQEPQELPHVFPHLDGIGRRRKRGRRRQASGSSNSQSQVEEMEEVGEEDPTATPKAHTCETVLGYPMAQTVPGTCALVAVTKCVEAQHRKEFEAIHGAKTFPCRAAAPRKLRQVCFRELVRNPSTGKRERTWDPKHGARYLERVLRKLIQLGGARTTNAPPPAPFVLPLADWEVYHHCEHSLTPELAKQLLHRRGPCVGTLFATEDFYRMDASLFSHRAPVAFRGCPREMREEVRGSDPNAAMHAVVCYAYCHNKQGKLLVLVLDNQQATGPSKWVHFDEFDSFYVLYVRPLSPQHLLGRSERPVYPASGTGYWAGSLQMGNGEEEMETGAEALETFEPPRS